MSLDAAWLAARLAGPAARLGVDLPAGAAAPLAGYAERLLAWSLRIRLTGARTPEALVDEHLADALALLPHLPDPPPAGGPPLRLVDVGSGGGLPGIPLALLRTDLDVTLLEPVAKKHAFLAAVRRELELGARVHVLRERVEAHRERTEPAGYDVAVSRATWPVAEWLVLGARLVRSGGRVLGLEGQEPAALPSGARRHPYRLSPDAPQRAVIVWMPGSPGSEGPS